MTNKEFTQQIDQLENLLFSFALRLTRNRQDAQDLVQETSLRAFRHREKFTMGTNFKSWATRHFRKPSLNVLWLFSSNIG